MAHQVFVGVAEEGVAGGAVAAEVETFEDADEAGEAVLPESRHTFSVELRRLPPPSTRPELRGPPDVG